MRLACQSLHPNFIAFEEYIAIPLVFEVNAELRIGDVANHNRSFACGLFKRVRAEIQPRIFAAEVLPGGLLMGQSAYKSAN